MSYRRHRVDFGVSARRLDYLHAQSDSRLRRYLLNQGLM